LRRLGDRTAGFGDRRRAGRYFLPGDVGQHLLNFGNGGRIAGHELGEYRLEAFESGHEIDRAEYPCACRRRSPAPRHRWTSRQACRSRCWKSAHRALRATDENDVATPAGDQHVADIFAERGALLKWRAAAPGFVVGDRQQVFVGQPERLPSISVLRLDRVVVGDWRTVACGAFSIGASRIASSARALISIFSARREITPSNRPTCSLENAGAGKKKIGDAPEDFRLFFVEPEVEGTLNLDQ